MTVIYALSGIALNHLNDWNPSFNIERQTVELTQPFSETPALEEEVRIFLGRYGESDSYKTHYYPSSDKLKIFIQNGSVDLDLSTGKGMLEKLNRRPVFFQVNYLHYNPKRLWTWFSDVFCAALITIAITGLFILRGKKGITRRGAWLTGAGLLIPLVFLVIYLN